MADINNAFLDVHILHGVPFSNLNRDNIGTPKQMVYGGATRSRISSQCTKRATRLWLEENTDMGKALRTRRLPQMVRETLTDDFAFSDDEAVHAVTALFVLAGIGVEAANPESDEDTEVASGELQGDQLTFTAADAARDLSIAIHDYKEPLLATTVKPAGTAGMASATKKKAKNVVRKLVTGPDKQAISRLLGPFERHNTVIALCGRMLADLPGSNVDGALQVAHAFTTHESSPDLDYFTAVDDVVQDDDEETGAGHIDVNEFTSGVFYRHATVGLGLLAASLDGSAEATAEAASAFVRAFTVAEPTGKQNTANAHTRPALIAVTLRSDRPVSLASAFEEPVAPRKGGGYMGESIDRLDKHAAADNRFYGDDGVVGAWYAHTLRDLDDLSGLGSRVDSLVDLVANVERAIEADVS